MLTNPENVPQAPRFCNLCLTDSFSGCSASFCTLFFSWFLKHVIFYSLQAITSFQISFSILCPKHLALAETYIYSEWFSNIKCSWYFFGRTDHVSFFIPIKIKCISLSSTILFSNKNMKQRTVTKIYFFTNIITYSYMYLI